MENNSTLCLAPGILIAAPELNDPNFHRSVILMVEHDEKGAFGLVINRPMETTVTELLSPLKIQYTGSSDKRAFLGGPVGQNHICFLHSSKYGWDATINVTDSINLSFSLEGLRELSEAAEEDFYVFVGSSGWGPSQLEAEMSKGTWFSHDITPELLFDTLPDRMWEQAFRSMGIDPNMIHTSYTVQ